MKVITRFYHSRPTRGAKLKPIGAVVWSYTDGWPFSFYEAAKRGLHTITRKLTGTGIAGSCYH